MIQLDRQPGHDFIHLPASLDKAYLERGLSRSLHRSVDIRSCRTSNLCAHKWGGVSDSGATVLRFSLDTSAGPLDLVAKILSPDTVNLFKNDTRCDVRLREVANRADDAVLGFLHRPNRDYQEAPGHPTSSTSMSSPSPAPDRRGGIRAHL